MTDNLVMTVKPIEGDDPASKLRREVCTMGGCPEGAECFCEQISDRDKYIEYQANEIITPQQIIAEMKRALGECYTALAFELENAVRRQDELAIIQIRRAQRLAHEALERAKP